METRNNWKGWLYLAPALILITLFTIFPILNTFVISFMKNYSYSTGANDGFTFDNYGVVLGLTPLVEGDSNTYMTEFIRYALPNTLLITFVTVPISVLLALVIAIALNRIKKVRSFFQTIFFLPYVTNTIAVGMVFALIFANTGLFNTVFGLGNLNWVGVGNTWGRAMFVICLYVIWTGLPFKILIFTSGLQNVDQQYYDAARIDASPKWKTDLKIVLPLISPQILYISVTSFISGFKEYNAIVGLFNRSYTTDGNLSNLYTVVYYIYDQIKGVGGGRPHLEYAASAAVILFVIILLFTLLQMQVSKRRVHY